MRANEPPDRLGQPTTVLTVAISNLQRRVPPDRPKIRRAVRLILGDHSVRRGSLSVVVVDDRTIRQLNRRHLACDEATDVLSFPLEQDDGYLEAEVVVSAERAAAVAARYGWTAPEELLLYVIHGTLHLVGWDDQDARARRRMRRQERAYLRRLGVPQPTARRRRNAQDESTPESVRLRPRRRREADGGEAKR
ncbi:MAG TPA: rRNA maturation RNase YbeY [Planctomycetes bacterium]|nr:rRNA maturation RNase YbeY [Planctomycetota bacterium]